MIAYYHLLRLHSQSNLHRRVGPPVGTGRDNNHAFHFFVQYCVPQPRQRHVVEPVSGADPLYICTPRGLPYGGAC